MQESSSAPGTRGTGDLQKALRIFLGKSHEGCKVKGGVGVETTGEQSGGGQPEQDGSKTSFTWCTVVPGVGGQVRESLRRATGVWYMGKAS